MKLITEETYVFSLCEFRERLGIDTVKSVVKVVFDYGSSSDVLVVCK